jgi:hypothetical protein
MKRLTRGVGALQALVASIGVVYLAGLIGITLAANGLPTAGWIGFGIVVAVVTGLTGTAIAYLGRMTHPPR